MADQWYTQRDGQKYGPFSPAQLKLMTVSGQLLPVDLVSKSADGKWVAASQIKGLFGAALVMPPAPANAFDFGGGPPPVPATAPSGTSVGVADREANPADPVAVAVGRLLGAKGMPPKVAMPVLGMLAVLGSTLALSLLGVLQAVADRHDLRFYLLTAFALSHSVLGVVATVLTARLRYSIAAPAAAILAATAFGWSVFASGWPIVWVLGLMAGVPLGAWALFTLRSPGVKAAFADAGKPGPLDRLGTPALAGVAGLMLAAILAVGGVLHTVARDKSLGEYAGVDPGPSLSGGTRQMKERTMPPPRQIKERTVKERATKSRTAEHIDRSHPLDLLIYGGDRVVGDARVLEHGAMGLPEHEWILTPIPPFKALLAWEQRQGAKLTHVAVLVVRDPSDDKRYVQKTYEGLSRPELSDLRDSLDETK